MSDAEYGQYEAGQEQGQLEEIHAEQGSVAETDSQFGVYQSDHHAAEATDFTKGHHEELNTPDGLHYESTDIVSYSHSAEVDETVFAAEGSETSMQADFSSLDALERQFAAAFAEGAELRTS